jgi:hypothetical protein
MFRETHYMGMRIHKKLIDVELEYQSDACDIERWVEATKILMSVLGDDSDSEGDTEISH